MPERDWERDWEWCERATPGPWSVDLYFGGGIKLIKKKPNGDLIVRDLFGTLQGIDNARLAAEAREALPYWLQRVRELEAVVEAAKAWRESQIEVNNSSYLGPSVENTKIHAAAINAHMKAEDELMATLAALEGGPCDV